MASIAHLLASRPGWRVSDIVCTAGPHDRRFEAQHAALCIAPVTQGTFQYRTRHGAAVLAPGTALLGNQGDCFECGHEHGTGDLSSFNRRFRRVMGASPSAYRARA